MYIYRIYIYTEYIYIEYIYIYMYERFHLLPENHVPKSYHVNKINNMINKKLSHKNFVSHKRIVNK